MAAVEIPNSDLPGGGQMGGTVAVCGDYNGDGLMDIVVGSTATTVPGLLKVVYAERIDTFSVQIDDADTMAVPTGFGDSSVRGLICLGDVWRDGVPDIGVLTGGTDPYVHLLNMVGGAGFIGQPLNYTDVVHLRVSDGWDEIPWTGEPNISIAAAPINIEDDMIDLVLGLPDLPIVHVWYLHPVTMTLMAQDKLRHDDWGLPVEMNSGFGMGVAIVQQTSHKNPSGATQVFITAYNETMPDGASGVYVFERRNDEFDSKWRMVASVYTSDIAFKQAKAAGRLPSGGARELTGQVVPLGRIIGKERLQQVLAPMALGAGAPHVVVLTFGDNWQLVRVHQILPSLIGSDMIDSLPLPLPPGHYALAPPWRISGSHVYLPVGLNSGSALVFLDIDYGGAVLQKSHCEYAPPVVLRGCDAFCGATHEIVSRAIVQVGRYGGVPCGPEIAYEPCPAPAPCVERVVVEAAVSSTSSPHEATLPGWHVPDAGVFSGGQVWCDLNLDGHDEAVWFAQLEGGSQLLVGNGGEANFTHIARHNVTWQTNVLSVANSDIILECLPAGVTDASAPRRYRQLLVTSPGLEFYWILAFNTTLINQQVVTGTSYSISGLLPTLVPRNMHFAGISTCIQPPTPASQDPWTSDSSAVGPDTHLIAIVCADDCALLLLRLLLGMHPSDPRGPLRFVAWVWTHALLQDVHTGEYVPGTPIIFPPVFPKISLQTMACEAGVDVARYTRPAFGGRSDVPQRMGYRILFGTMDLRLRRSGDRPIALAELTFVVSSKASDQLWLGSYRLLTADEVYGAVGKLLRDTDRMDWRVQGVAFAGDVDADNTTDFVIAMNGTSSMRQVMLISWPPQQQAIVTSALLPRETVNSPGVPIRAPAVRGGELVLQDIPGTLQGVRAVTRVVNGHSYVRLLLSYSTDHSAQAFSIRLNLTHSQGK